MKMKRLLLLGCLCACITIQAQQVQRDKNDPAYLKGAIQWVDGKIEFTRSFELPGQTKQQIYNRMLQWAEQRFNPSDKLQSRVVYSNADEGKIAAMAEEYLVFSSSTLSLDRTRIYYLLSLDIADSKLMVSMSRIKYWYNENRNGGERYVAEEWISDDMALNKKGTKLSPITGKFRRETIDLKDDLMAEIEKTVGGTAAVKPKQRETVSPINVKNERFVRLQANGESVEVPETLIFNEPNQSVCRIVVPKDKITVNAFLSQYRDFEAISAIGKINFKVIENKPLDEVLRSAHPNRFDRDKEYVVYVCQQQ